MDQSLITAIYALLCAFVISVILCPIVIPYFTKLKYGQTIRDDGPESHKVKAGTPTMGGVVILAGLIVSSVIFMWGNKDALAVLLTTAGFGAVGFADDYIKVVKKRSLGLKPMQKFIPLLIVSGLFIWYLYASGIDLKVYIPFTNAYYLDLKFLTIPFMLFVLLGATNGANLTDGLDGLASGVTALILTFLFFMAYAADNPIISVTGAAVGALLGFLLFNSHPAKVIMGDTGALALGGLVASVAILLRMPVVIAIVAFVYVAESLSVIIQVGYFKITKRVYGKGRRVFKMAPLHHHFELSGMKETQIVSLFYIATAILCLVGFLATQHLLFN